MPSHAAYMCQHTGVAHDADFAIYTHSPVKPSPFFLKETLHTPLILKKTQSLKSLQDTVPAKILYHIANIS